MKKIGDIANVTKLAGFEYSEYIQGYSTHKKIKDTDMPLFIGKTIRDGKIDQNFDWYISKEISDKLVRSKLDKKALVLPYVGSVGDLAIFDGSYLAHMGSNVAKIEFNTNDYILEFVYYYLKSPYGQRMLLRDIQGAVQKNITMEAIRNVELPNVSLEVQKKIVNIVKPIDDRIDINNKLITEYESLMQNLYDYWFVQFDFPDEKGRPYKSSGGKMTYNKELKREVPEGWGVKNISDLLEVVTGKEDASFSQKDGKYLFFTCSNDTLLCDKPAFNGKAILIAGNGDFNVKYYDGEFNAYQRTYVLLPNDEIYVASIYMSILQTLEKFKKGSNGSIIKFIHKSDVENVKVIIPNKKELLTTLNNYLFAIDKYKKMNNEISKYKNFILPLLLNGQVKI